MNFRFAFLLFCALAVPIFAEESTTLMEASRPLAEGVPEVAVVRLRELLATKLSEEDGNAATIKLGEALVASGDFAEALKVLQASSVRELSAAKYFQAQALAGQLRWAEALPLYQACANDQTSPLRSDALFGEAESLRALDRPNESLQAFEILRRDPRWSRRAQMRAVELLLAKGDTGNATHLLDAMQPASAAEHSERRLLRGRVQMALHRNDKAIELFTAVLKNQQGTTHPVLLATLFAIADAYLQIGAPTTGDDFLEDFIERHPHDRALPEVFAKLDQLYAAEKKPSRHDLSRWTLDANEPRHSLSRWYLARAEMRLGHRDVALQALANLRADHPPLPAFAEALLEYAELERQDGRLENAAAALKEANTLNPAPAIAERINLLAGETQYAAKHFEQAAQIFQKIAHSPSPYAKDAFYDASLAWLQTGETKEVAKAAQELKESGADDRTRGDLLLEQGLVQAGRGEKSATDSLRIFLRQFPRHPRASEAWVALAELAFHSAPPRLEEARKDLAEAEANHPTPPASERADYLRIWIEDAAPAPNEEKVIALANEFLQKHQASPLTPDVRLKLAETDYRRQDFAGAQTQFEILAQRDPNSPLAEQAQFFAAQSAMQSMGAASLDRALVLFDAVVKRNGEMKWAARNEQAVIERKLGKPDDAMTLYDEVLKGDAQPSEKREALCAKGDILYDLGTQDPANYKRAMEFYEQVAAQPEAAAHWRNQALFKKGMCLEKLRLPEEALATFYQIIDDQSHTERQREFFWFYKAGFNAARLLEENSKWEPAAAIYEKLAFAGGGRSEEAKARLNRLRLEHFLWDQ